MKKTIKDWFYSIVRGVLSLGIAWLIVSFVLFFGFKWLAYFNHIPWLVGPLTLLIAIAVHKSIVEEAKSH